MAGISKVGGGAAVITAGGCGFASKYTVNEMLLVIICILLTCLIVQIIISVRNCRERKKRTEDILKRRCEHGKPGRSGISERTF